MYSSKDTESGGEVQGFADDCRRIRSRVAMVIDRKSALPRRHAWLDCEYRMTCILLGKPTVAFVNSALQGSTAGMTITASQRRIHGCPQARDLLPT
jgi:hypothetical protein